MRWLQSISFTSPSSSSSSPASSHHSSSNSSRGRKAATKNQFNYNDSSGNSNSNQNNQPNSNNQQQQQHRNKRGPRLTRQKKLRHLSDQQMAGVVNFTRDESAESVVLSRSNSNYDQSSSSTTFKLSPSGIAQPLPLPLPLPVPEESGELRLLSPREAGGNGRAREERERDLLRDRDRVDGAGDAVSSPLASSIGRKIPMNMDMRPSRPVHQDQYSVDNYRENFRLNIPAKSAPASPFASPVLSPKRTSVGEMFQNYYKAPKGNQGWSAPEIQHLDIPGLPPPAGWSAPEIQPLDIPGLPPPAFFDYAAFSSESSPFHSPRSRSPCRNPMSPSGPSSPIHSKFSRESTGLLEVHPLPLPPRAAISTPSSPVRQVSVKPESLPMTDKWQKGKLIGRGTFGSVYVASNRETGALCAMKEVELFPDDPKSAECIKQLEQEIKVLSHLKHPNIVQYYGSEIVEDKFYIYLEYVHPGSINKYVREHCGAITESVVRNFTRHILSGLDYLHRKKTIHRDIKGANLLVDALGVVKLADFGMAKHLTGQAADLSLKGSPYWMAPELMMAVMQRDNNSDLALAVDIWSLGCTIIEMFTGKPPWSEYEGAAAMFKVMKDMPPIPENLSAEGKDFLRCCFRRDPAKRPTASMLLEHRFVKNSQQADVPSCSLSFGGMKLTDNSQSPREQFESKIDQFLVHSSSLSPKKMTSESENGQRSNLETSDLTVKSNYSPRSILEDLPSFSPLHAGCRMNHSGPPVVILDQVRRGSKKNFVCN